MMRTVRTSQPQGPVGVDWGNPITRGLVSAISAAHQSEIVRGRAITQVGAKTVASKGVALPVTATSYTSTASPKTSFRDMTMVVVGSTGSIVSNSDFAHLFVGGGNTGSAFSGLTQSTFAAGTEITSNIYYSPSFNGSSSCSANILSANKEYVIATRYRRNIANELFSNGLIKASSVPADLDANFSHTSAEIFASAGPSARNLKIALALFFDRALSDAEIKSLSDNPWQIFQPTNRAIWVPVAATVVSISRPSADVTTTGWTGTPDNTNKFNNIDEVTASDTDYITSPAITGGENITFTITPSLAAGTWDVRYRAQFAGASAQVRIHLLDGSNVAQGVSSWQTVTSSFALYTASVTTTGTAVRVRIEVQ